MKGTDSFFSNVFDICQQIPKGRVTSYGAIAKAIGSPQSSRMVGWAMNKSFHHEVAIPAHRVLNRNGMLTGKKAFGNPDLMQTLLEHEGIEIRNDHVVNFQKHFWDPWLELELDEYI